MDETLTISKREFRFIPDKEGVEILEEFYDKLKEFLKSHLKETLPIGSIYQIDKITITIDTIHGNTHATTFTIN